MSECCCLYLIGIYLMFYEVEDEQKILIHLNTHNTKTERKKISKIRMKKKQVNLSSSLIGQTRQTRKISSSQNSSHFSFKLIFYSKKQEKTSELEVSRFVSHRIIFNIYLLTYIIHVTVTQTKTTVGGVIWTIITI